MIKEGRTKVYWAIGIFLIFVIIGYFGYQKYRNINTQIAKMDSIIAVQQTIIEGNQKTIEANDIVIAEKERLYRNLKGKLTQYIKDAEAIKPPQGKIAIQECFGKHGFKPEVGK